MFVNLITIPKRRIVFMPLRAARCISTLPSQSKCNSQDHEDNAPLSDIMVEDQSRVTLNQEDKAAEVKPGRPVYPREDGPSSKNSREENAVEPVVQRRIPPGNIRHGHLRKDSADEHNSRGKGSGEPNERAQDG
jgi:hypothetical protein